MGEVHVCTAYGSSYDVLEVGSLRCSGGAASKFGKEGVLPPTQNFSCVGVPVWESGWLLVLPPVRLSVLSLCCLCAVCMPSSCTERKKNASISASLVSVCLNKRVYIT